jgi:signal peptidase I
METTRFVISKRFLSLFLKGSVGFVVLFLFIRFFVVSPSAVNGKSMEPTLPDSKFFLVNKFIYLFHQPDKYDIVQFIDPASKKLIIKRIIGMPGEIIIIKRGKVYVQQDLMDAEKEIPEPYLGTDIVTNIMGQEAPRKFLVGTNQYYVLGDNRPHSTDSRSFGPVSRENIVGKVLTFKSS